MWSSQSQITVNLNQFISSGIMDVEKRNFITGSQNDREMLIVTTRRRISIRKRLSTLELDGKRYELISTYSSGNSVGYKRVSSQRATHRSFPRELMIWFLKRVRSGDSQRIPITRQTISTITWFGVCDEVLIVEIGLSQPHSNGAPCSLFCRLHFTSCTTFLDRHYKGR
jgi:hypothetical protein